jgi:hypothetical protein
MSLQNWANNGCAHTTIERQRRGIFIVGAIIHQQAPSERHLLHFAPMELGSNKHTGSINIRLLWSQHA